MNPSELVLDRLAGRATQLYSLPTVAMKVLELAGNPRVDTHALKACIEKDPALTGKILRVVNSSLFGLSREVSDLSQALTLLGSKPLKMLVLGFSLPPGLYAQVEGNVLQRYWRHTLTKAVAGREISESLWQIPGDDAFVVGLLQDLGQLLLIQEIGEPYCRLLRKVEEGHFDLATVEVEIMGFDHTALTARLLAKWHLPATLTEAVPWGEGRRPSDGAGRGRSPLQKILHLAELLAGFLADGRPEALAEVLIIGRNYREFSDEQLERLVEALEEKVRHLAEVLSLELPDGMNYTDVLIRAHRQMSAVAESLAQSLLDGEDEPCSTAEEQSLLNEVQDLADAVARYRTAAPVVAGAKAAPVAARAVAAACADSASVATAGSSTRTCPEGLPAGDVEAQRDDLMRHLALAGRVCRNVRRPLSLLLLRLTGSVDERFPVGSAGYELLLCELERGCRELDHHCAICRPDSPGGFALILPDCERSQAVEYGNQLSRRLRCRVNESEWMGRAAEGLVSVGAATISLPPRNFSPADMVAAAARCMYASCSSGGVVKSLEIY